MRYKLCCGQISVVVHSSSTRRRPSSPEDLEPPRVSEWTSSSCTAPLLHPEIFVFFQCHVLETSSTRPLAHWEASGHCPAVSSHGLTLTLHTHFTRRLQEKIQNMSHNVQCGPVWTHPVRRRGSARTALWPDSPSPGRSCSAG